MTRRHRTPRQASLHMTPFATFIYNALTMGVIFPWVFVVGSATSPDGSLYQGILIAIALQVPLTVSYAFLATAMPSMGGDYTYQRRILGQGAAFVIVFSGFVLWVLEWLALSGWMLVSLGISPLLLSLGVTYHLSVLIHWGLTINQPLDATLISIVASGLATVLLVRRFSGYLTMQYALFYLTLAASAIMIGLLALATPDQFFARLNHFATPITGNTHFVATIYHLATQLGWHSAHGTHFGETLAIAPIAWMNLQWCTYSVEQGTEVTPTGMFRINLAVMLGPLFFIGLLLAGLAYVETHTVTLRFLSAYARVYTQKPLVLPLRPFPGIFALVLTRQPWLIVILAMGFIANSFQIFANSYIGITRIIAVMADDGLLPRWLAERHPRFHTFHNAHLVYFLAGVLWILLYNFDPVWIRNTLGVALANGYVFVASAGVSAVWMPYRQLGIDHVFRT
ncbi:MAG: amino acid permease [Firmicutes bacterium]|nr:amino acid permease [Bacillota bacterium]